MVAARSPKRPFTATLPGPDRKRKPSAYCFRVTYRNLRPQEPGCVMTWNVAGGRTPYQIALERVNEHEIHWHCTCADAVYRGDRNPFYVCKHVHALQCGRWG